MVCSHAYSAACRSLIKTANAAAANSGLHPLMWVYSLWRILQEYFCGDKNSVLCLFGICSGSVHWPFHTLLLKYWPIFGGWSGIILPTDWNTTLWTSCWWVRVIAGQQPDQGPEDNGSADLESKGQSKQANSRRIRSFFCWFERCCEIGSSELKKKLSSQLK